MVLKSSAHKGWKQKSWTQSKDGKSPSMKMDEEGQRGDGLKDRGPLAENVESIKDH